MKVRNALVIAAAGILVVAAAPPASADASAIGGDQLYVLNGGDDSGADANVARFGIGANGLVSPEGTTKADSAGGLVFTPPLGAAGLQFAYSATDVVNAIDRFRVGPGGALSLVGTTPSQEPFDIAIDPHGPTVFVSNFNGDDEGMISAFHVQPNGDLKFINSILSGDIHPKGIAVTPDGRFLYVAHGTPRSPSPRPTIVVGFAVGADGRLSETPVAKAQIGASGHRAVITPDGRFLYVTMQEAGDTGDVFGYRIGASGELTPVSEKPFEAGVWTEGVATTPDGRRLYVGSLGVVASPDADGEVRGFDIGPDGTLTEVARAAAGLDPNDLAVGLDGKHVYLGDFTGNTVLVFAAGATGGLKLLQTVPSQGLGPSYHGVAVQPSHL
jgi:DNA-binding beta-propeller fold protein YncE